MKKTVFLIMILLISLPVCAEEVYLKDGTVISGTITGSDTEIMKVKTSYGEVLVKMSEIKDIEYVKQKREEKKEEAPRGPVFHEADISTKVFSIGFHEDASFFSFFDIGGNIKWWITPDIGFRAGVGFPILSWYGPVSPLINLEGFWGFSRNKRYNLYLGGGMIINNPANAWVPGLVGLFGIEFFYPRSRYDTYWAPQTDIYEYPMPVSLEIGYYFNPMNLDDKGFYFHYGMEIYLF
ncbi:hypothetical protein COY52_04270 [Candidatus Desantisbacteria bacterium CG_4_10_14_0_8_um_filter_48_22]|uniref:Uncharacterized protein n=1 Tax=Candidatus Desantisbacteria bacterium CG_4_10_14_0_8_um_filter_48_22 TaxID=1974543 RepID=A0A2M7SDY8_9BACT|nr:MAG: hypothetical protein AUJ67_10200 [Candidatus Desantisbacteria bacterium CG1_02_49_89]PIV54446.1 MAG: hypothetical protein COS16_10320 [Candidatus Desantisbacteria bacterium CG02_land_8_20_14_3_00_49_13]PIZ17513.1 MAG: hypothetical protein COY52_04270 [Candidatus Desantisbacteria bacterium CG_4_10_14_0_8_um_filter_48_22]PJB28362.1 MAG: hypothetical protein CO111_01835 [Candidatus Desantisbacteria bacterium CG_4_9_14_3_um_filter_50_7]